MNIKKELTLLTALLLLTGCSGKTDNYTFTPSDTTGLIKEAEALYETGDYRKSMEIYGTAMAENPKDMTSRLGAIRCEIALENYSSAVSDLSIALKLDPCNEEIYDLYFDVSKKSDNLSIAETAIKYAERYKLENILSKVPSAPVTENITVPGFDGQVLKVNCDNDAEVYYRLENTNYSHETGLKKYRDSGIYMTQGLNELTLYSVKDGIPSKEVKAEYDIPENHEEVTFADPVVEALIRHTLGKESGPVTNDDLCTIEEFDYNDISSLEGYSHKTEDSFKINTLEDFKKFPFLNHVYLDGLSNSYDYAPLSACMYLSYFSQTYSELDNLDFLNMLQNPKYLIFDENNISDISVIGSYYGLYELNLTNNPVTDLTPLKASKNLQYLSLSDKSLDFQVLNELKKLRILQIRGFDFDRNGLSSLNALEELSIYHSDDNWDASLNDLSFLEKMQSLTYLNISGVDDPSELEHIKKLTNLEKLYLNGKATNDTDAIEALEEALPKCEIHI